MALKRSEAILHYAGQKRMTADECGRGHCVSLHFGHFPKHISVCVAIVRSWAKTWNSHLALGAVQNAKCVLKCSNGNNTNF